jgi:hypothetical protein
MMPLCQSWGWQPPKTASHIHIRLIQSVWAHWYAVHGHTVSALHSFTHLAQILGFSGSLVESKWCHYVMVEANGHLKLLPTSILNICKVFEHINMLSIGIQYQHYTVLPTLLGSDYGDWVTCGVKWCDYVMVEADSHHKLLPTSILDIYKVFEHIDMLSIGIW